MTDTTDQQPTGEAGEAAAQALDTKAARYVYLRAQGYGTRSAARRAGFKHGTPSPQARDLWADFEDFQDRTVKPQARNLRAYAEKQRAEARRARRRAKAARILDVYRTGDDNPLDSHDQGQ